MCREESGQLLGYTALQLDGKVAVVVGGLLTNLVTNDGIEGMKAKPRRTVVMLMIILAAAIFATILSATG